MQNENPPMKNMAPAAQLFRFSRYDKGYSRFLNSVKGICSSMLELQQINSFNSVF